MTDIAIASTPQVTVTAPVASKWPEEMTRAQQSMIGWFEYKAAQIKAEAKDLQEAYKIARRCKWRSSALKRQAEIAEKRAHFYLKITEALRQGYTLIPNFPVQIFAIRTDAKNPRAEISYSRWDNREQKAKPLEIGSGQYKNPLPVLDQSDVAATENGKEVIKTEHWASDFQDEIEFPVTLAKPQIMAATERAMALKLFDSFGVFPNSRKDDPVITARILDPRPPGYGDQKFVSFLITWHIDLDTI